MIKRSIICIDDKKILYCDNRESKFKTLFVGENIQQIARSENHMMFTNVTKSGTELFVFGTSTTKPELLMTSEIKQIACGQNHFVILKHGGEVLVFGDNYNYQLGIPKLKSLDKSYINKLLSPFSVMVDPTIKQIACGYNFSLILKNNGELLGFGANTFNQLAIPNCIKIKVPTIIMNDPKIEQIYCGGYHSIVLKSNGEIYRTGYLNDANEHFELLNDSILSSKSSSEINQISCGAFHTMILKNDGTLIVSGHNYFGQLGLRDCRTVVEPTVLMINEDIKAISCYNNNSMILFKNGELIGFGENIDGQLGKSVDNSLKLATKSNVFESILIMKDTNISMLNNVCVKQNWTYNNHIYFSDAFKQRILLFVMYLKRNQMETKMKIPKFVLFEIIKRII